MVRAAVLDAPGRFELRTFDRPIATTGAVLDVEACGLCGTDLDVARGTIALRGPTIPGHEILGTIASIADDYAASTGLRTGDRVVVPGELHCGTCVGCLADESCLASPGTHGFVPVDVAPALWGGFAEAMVLSPQTRPLPIAAHVPVARAALFNLLGAGYAWGVEAPGLRAGQTIVVLGPGQRGLACVIAASDEGARVVAVSGLASDERKLGIAAALGAETTVSIDTEDLVTTVLERTDGAGVNVVVDTTPHSTDAVLDALSIVRPGGTVVIAGMKGRPVPAFPTDTLAMRRITVRGVRAVTRGAFRRAITLLESDDPRPDLLATHAFDLADVDRAIATLDSDPDAIAICIGPFA